MVFSFKYLGSIFTGQANKPTSRSVSSAISCGLAALRTVCRLAKIGNLRYETHRRLIKTIVFPAVYFGSETWRITRVLECQLFAFINRCRAVVLKVPLLKRRRNGLRRSISNSLLKQRAKLQSPRISIAKRRLEFLANMVNRNEEKGTDLVRWLLKAELDPKEHGWW